MDIPFAYYLSIFPIDLTHEYFAMDIMHGYYLSIISMDTIYATCPSILSMDIIDGSILFNIEKDTMEPRVL